MTGVAIGIRVFVDTGNATPLLLTSFFSALPLMVGGSLAGVLVDRWKRKTVLIAADIGQAVGTALLLLSFLSGEFQLWHLYLVSLLAGALDMLQRPAMEASVTMLVPDSHRDQANVIRQIAGQDLTLSGKRPAVVETKKSRVGNRSAVRVASPLGQDHRVAVAAGSIHFIRGCRVQPFIFRMVAGVIGTQFQEQTTCGRRCKHRGDIVTGRPGCNLNIPLAFQGWKRKTAVRTRHCTVRRRPDGYNGSLRRCASFRKQHHPLDIPERQKLPGSSSPVVLRSKGQWLRIK
ncbi:MAG: MFS transporter [Anaerolineaceae bacterium]|nr:MFS transporter [Anaerolineaceae bacterium]